MRRTVTVLSMSTLPATNRPRPSAPRSTTSAATPPTAARIGMGARRLARRYFEREIRLNAMSMGTSVTKPTANSARSVLFSRSGMPQPNIADSERAAKASSSATTSTNVARRVRSTSRRSLTTAASVSPCSRRCGTTARAIPASETAISSASDCPCVPGRNRPPDSIERATVARACPVTVSPMSTNPTENGKCPTTIIAITTLVISA